jgi:glycosyltransferase 2 family protein
MFYLLGIYEVYMKERIKSIARIILAIVVLVACVYYSMKDINIAELWSIILNANYLWVLLPVPVIILSHWVRAVRWKRILKPIKKDISTWNLFSSVMVGYALNGITPRGGEFIRPYTLSRREKVSYSSALATIVVERFIDLLTLVIMLAGTFIFLSEKIIKGLPAEYIDTTRIVMFGLMFLGILVLAFYPPSLRFLLKIIIKPISHKFYDKISALYEKFVVGLSIIKSPSQYLMLIGESLLIWLLYTLPMFFMFFSFGFQNSVHLGFQDAILMIVVSGVITTVSPTPGAIGLYHVAIQGAMVSIYGISSVEAMAYATLTHGVNYLVQMVLGGLFFFRENVKNVQKDAIEVS